MALLVAQARARNATAGLTGALIRTSTHYAQFLQGPEHAVDRIMTSIGADPRHRHLQQFENVSQPQRRYSQWSLAYAGPSTFLDRAVRLLFQHDCAARTVKCAELLDLFDDFTTSAAPPGRS